jgi:hypothetical protein
MTALPALDERLRALGASRFPHLNGTLERHLQGTERLLRRWGNREALCVAGLYHAVYGTVGIEGCLTGLDAREALSRLIGPEAEALVYLYAACDRDRFHPRIGTAAQNAFVDRFKGREYAIDEAQLSDFCEMSVANELDLALGNADFARRHADALLGLVDRMRGLISGPAQRAAWTLLSAARSTQRD